MRSKSPVINSPSPKGKFRKLPSSRYFLIAGFADATKNGMRPILIAIILNIGTRLYGAELIPLPDNESAWIHTQCHNNLLGIVVAGKSVTDSCRVRDGISKAEWKGGSTEYGEVFCREGATGCEVLSWRGRSYRRITEEFSCRDGRKDGLYTAHIGDSRKNTGYRVEADYVLGRLHGTSRHFRSDDSLCQTYEYKNGLLDGVSRYYDKGKPERCLEEIAFVAGLRHGMTIQYAPSDGSIASEETWFRGVLRRMVHYTGSDGWTISEAKWKKGNLQGSAVKVTRIESIYSAGKLVKRIEKRSDGTIQVLGPTELAQEEKIREEKWKEAVAKSDPRRRRPFVGLGLNLAAINDVRRTEGEVSRLTRFSPGAQLYLGSIVCGDVGCGGYIGSVGLSKSAVSDGLAFFGEIGLGGVAMIVDFYGGLGARRDGDRLGAQATALLGFGFVGLYGRVIAWPDSRDMAMEAGIQAWIPILKWGA